MAQTWMFVGAALRGRPFRQTRLSHKTGGHGVPPLQRPKYDAQFVSKTGHDLDDQYRKT